MVKPVDFMQFIHYNINFWIFVVNYNEKYQSMLVNNIVIIYNITYISKNQRRKIMVKDTISVVKKAESEAASLAKKTEEKQLSLLNQARQEVVSLEQQQQQQIADYQEKAEEEAKIKNQEVMKQVEEEAERKILQLKNKAAEKKKEAIQLILDTIG